LTKKVSAPKLEKPKLQKGMENWEKRSQTEILADKRKKKFILETHMVRKGKIRGKLTGEKG